MSAVGLLLLVLLTPACGDWFKKKAPETAATLEAVQEPKLRLIDVNSEEVFNDAHIPGAINLSVDRIEEVAKDWNKKTPVVVYCSDYTCQASHGAAQKFTQLGFEDVSIYAGGINEWYKKGKDNLTAYPLEGEHKQAFLEKDVAVATPKEGERVISADDLSKRLEEAKK